MERGGGWRRLAEHCFVTIHYSFRAVATGRPLSSAERSEQAFFFLLSLLFEGPERVTDATPDNISLLFATAQKKNVLKHIAVLEQRAQCKTANGLSPSWFGVPSLLVVNNLRL